MIVKMRFIYLIGNTKNIGHVIEKYISKFDMQLEVATQEFYGDEDVSELNSDLENRNKLIINKEELKRKAEYILKSSRIPTVKNNKVKISQSDAIKILDQAVEFYEKRNERLSYLESTRKDMIELISNLDHFKIFDFDFCDLNKFKFVQYKFGSMPLNNYKQYKSFLFDDKDIFLVRTETEENLVWCAYFAHKSSVKRADEIFESLNFEEIILPFEINDLKLCGPIKKVISDLNNNLEKINAEIEKIKSNLQNEIELKETFAAKKILESLQNVNAIKFAGSIHKNFFIFTGWVTEEVFLQLKEKIQNDETTIMIVEKNHSNPPVKLVNNSFFKPFEFLVELYGIPSYYEIDPTPFLAMTYTILFGLMFGDVGQGLVLLLIGLIMSHKKNSNPLFSIMKFLGVSSIAFGFLYGSVFGFENIIRALWMKPSDNINFILMFAVISGIFLILVSMIFNLINCQRSKEFIDMFVGANGLSGLIFYVCILLIIFFAIANIKSNFMIIIWILAIINLLLIMFSDVIRKLFLGEKQIFGSNPLLFLFETFINLFETLLSYFTNTVSFVRVGAFALSHAGMMSVVMLLSKSETNSYNWFIVILGNILVIILEGLIVGIQVLRLEFYEMFGRFFRAGGTEYTPRNKFE
jgi:V/A-type H+-transporting ATPase subunit I